MRSILMFTGAKFGPLAAGSPPQYRLTVNIISGLLGKYFHVSHEQTNLQEEFQLRLDDA